MELKIADRTLFGPVLIPSISKFETQGSPLGAIKLQHALNEPITLVSAHDTANDSELIEQVSEFRSAKRIVFIDSGGYEYSRIAKYSSEYVHSWSFEKFKAAVSRCPHDLAASYDYFLDENSNVGEYSDKLLDGMRDHDFIDCDKLVPVIHLQTFRGTQYLSPKEAIDVVDRIAAELEPPFIAIPERELGAGLAKKAQLVKQIVQLLNEKGRPTKLHVLGCGNPLTFAILAQAGMAMADGLEWCRTLVGPNFHLHHFQQGELFPEPQNDVHNPMAELIRDEVDDYVVRTLSRNLHAMQAFQRFVGDMLHDGTLKGFLKGNFGAQATL